MRELKFRSYMKPDKKFHFWGFLGVGFTAPVHINGVMLKDAEQFTGLLDKNGKEIYEGDITFSKWEEYGVGRDDGSKSIVHQCKRLGGWGTYNVGEECGKWCMHLKFHCFPKHTEVIGNIHENPELLKP